MTCTSKVVFAAAAFSAGCSNLDGASTDAGSDTGVSLDAADIDAGPLPDGDFGCAGEPLPTAATDPLQLTGQLHFSLMGSLVNDATIEVRATAGDALLGQAITGYVKGIGIGAYQVAVSSGGTAATVYRTARHRSYVTMYMYDSRPVAETAHWSQSVHTRTTFEDLQRQAGYTPEPDKGVISVGVRDCAEANGGAQVVGATIDAPPGARVVYLSGTGTPDITLTSTTAWGEALIVGVTPGIVDVVVHAGPVRYRSWPVRVIAGDWTLSLRRP